MSAAVTFGSVGDIIAVCKIASGLAKALSNTRGSAKAYRTLIVRLEVYHQAMLQATLLLQTYRGYEQLRELSDVATKAIHDTQIPLTCFHDKILAKYKDCLDINSTGGRLLVLRKKITWHIREREEAERLEALLHQTTDLVTGIMVMVTGQLARMNNTSLMASIVNMDNYLKDQSANFAERMKQLHLSVESQGLRETQTKDNINAEMVQMQSIVNNLTQMRSYLEEIHLQIVTQQKPPTTIQRCWSQEPVTLEDALGRQSPVHLEFIDSWVVSYELILNLKHAEFYWTFDAVIEARFRDLPGHQKITQGEYILRDSISRREIKRRLPWQAAFLPGQRIDMSIIFRSLDKTNRCPRCLSDASEDTTIDTVECRSSGAHFQMVEEQVCWSSTWLPIYLRARQPAVKRNTAQVNQVRSSDAVAKHEDKPAQFKRTKIITSGRFINHFDNLLHDKDLKSFDSPAGGTRFCELFRQDLIENSTSDIQLDKDLVKRIVTTVVKGLNGDFDV